MVNFANLCLLCRTHGNLWDAVETNDIKAVE